MLSYLDIWLQGLRIIT